MKFTVSSSTLLNRLQTVGKVVATKNAITILDNFLLDIKGNTLTIVASDQETTISSCIQIDNNEGDVKIAIPAKFLVETFKVFSEQPLTFDINTDNLAIEIKTETGKFNFVGQNGELYPSEPALDGESVETQIESDVLNSGINKTLFATAVEDTRPTMTGIYFDIINDKITLVATDAHKLACCTYSGITSNITNSFILPKKSASMLKNILLSDKGNVNISFDNKAIIFQTENYRVRCLKIAGKYPGYRSVIPTNNPFDIIIDRSVFANAIRRISPFANQATNLIKLSISNGSINLSAQDIDYSSAAEERISCNYEGDPINIGFKATLLSDILSNLDTKEVRLLLADPTRPGLILPFENEENEDITMLLMPMLINE